jgi:sterol 14alpha-demethylase
MQQKKFVKVGLSTDNFRAYMDMIKDETEQFIKSDPTFVAYHTSDRQWGRLSSIKATSELIILTASRTLQGSEVRSRLDKTFAQRYSDLDGGFTPLNFLFPSLPLPNYYRRDKAQRAMSQFYHDIIQARRNGLSDNDEHDMLTALETQTYRDGRALSDIERAHIMITLLMAGQHTSSSTSSWILLHIADRPDVQKALYEEQIKHLRDEDGKFRTMKYEGLKELPLLDAVIRETLRIHPPIHSIMVRLFIVASTIIAH